MCRPVGVHLLTLLDEGVTSGEPALLDVRRCSHVGLGRIQHQKLRVCSCLEVGPGHRDVFLVDAEQSAAPDHEVVDFASLWAEHQVVDPAKRVALFVVDTGSTRFVQSGSPIAIGEMSTLSLASQLPVSTTR
jgi:hypothetical protein